MWVGYDGYVYYVLGWFACGMLWWRVGSSVVCVVVWLYLISWFVCCFGVTSFRFAVCWVACFGFLFALPLFLGVYYGCRVRCVGLLDVVV